MMKNSQDTGKATGSDKMVVLIIIFLVAALIHFLLMMISAGKALAGPWSDEVEIGFGYGNRSYNVTRLTSEQSAMRQALHQHYREKIVSHRP